LGGPEPLKLVCKGAPEALAKLASNTPPNLDEMITHYVKQGLRVIALAIRDLDPDMSLRVQSLTREEVERDLTFLGFFVLRSPLKKNTARVIG
jgi:magnesium-transporting ATPase (P-type)